MSGICRQPGCPCRNPAEDEAPRGIAPARPSVPGHPMPAGWKQQVAAELAARKRARTTVTEDPS